MTSSSAFRACVSSQRLTNQQKHRYPSLISRRFRTTYNVSGDVTSSASTNIDNNSKSEYLTNDGVIEGVWIFCRHGDRSPSRPLSPLHRRQEEAAFWVTKLPVTDSAAAFENFCRYYPFEIHNPDSTNHGQFLDTHRNPFGFLTQTGIQQLRENGRRFFNRYNEHGHHLPERKSWRHEYAQDFLSVWDISVYSTNYLRTIMSAQSFLDGLLGTHSYAVRTKDGANQRPYNPSIFRELRVPHHNWRRPDFASTALVPIQIRKVANDPLNAFDRHPALMADLINQVLNKEDFINYDSSVIPLATRLANVLPGLVRPRRTDFSTRSPSGINWVEAADHFVCRQAHNLPLAAFTDFENDDRVEETLQACAYPTLAHLSWRFRQWYRNSNLLAAVAAPPLREMALQMQATPALGEHDKRPFVVYSCHDVTLLGLLYGIQADFLADDESADWRFWPSYGSMLVFELVRITNSDSGNKVRSKRYGRKVAAKTDKDSYVVRVLLNGKPVKSVSLDSVRAKIPIGHGPEEMMWIDDFEQIVKGLEANLLHH